MTEETKAGLRVALYARVSSEEQRTGQTIRSQIAELENFAKAKGWKISETYSDDGWSGGLLNRPQLDRLRDHADTGKFDAVLINDVDRLARDVAHLGVIKRDLERRGVQLIFRKLPSKQDPTYNLLVNILASFAEFEKELITDRMRRGRRYKVEVAKQFLGCKAAYGYSYGPTKKDRGARSTGKLKVNPQEAAVVRRIYKWVDEEGLSIRKVVKRLQERKIPSRSGLPWRFSSVQRILRRETYVGVWYYNRHKNCEAKWPRKRRYQSNPVQRPRPKDEWIRLELPKELHIMDRELWERVQSRLDSNSTFSARNSRRNYLLRSLVRCGGCFSTYVGSKNKAGKTYYRCYKACKRYPSVHEEVLDKAVLEAVLGVLTDPRTLAKKIKELDKADLKAEDSRSSEQEQVRRDLQSLDREETRMIEAYRIGIISQSQLSRELDGIKIRRRELLKDQQALTIQASKQQPKSADPTESPIARFCRRLARGLQKAETTLKQHLLWQVVDRIVFEGSQVQIAMKIPLEPEDRTPSGSIANASVYQTVRNPTLEIALTRRISTTAKTYRVRTAA